MANWTDSVGRVKGSKENIEKFFEILGNKNEELPYLQRTQLNWYEVEDGSSSPFDFSCAWSVEGCWINCVLDKEEYPLMTNIMEITKDLDLEVKIVSAEPGVHFLEYLHIDKGEVKAEEFWAEEDTEKIKVDCPRSEKSWTQLYTLFDQIVEEKLHL